MKASPSPAARQTSHRFPIALPPVLRMINELAFNISKYAPPGSTVEFSTHLEKSTLTVHSKNTLQRKNTPGADYGLAGVTERINALGGTINIHKKKLRNHHLPPPSKKEKTMTPKIRVAVIDDVPEALAFYITCCPDTLELIDQASNGVQAVELAHTLHPDVVLMDGVEASKIILTELPDTKIIAISIFHSNDYVVPALQTGVHGYLLKDSLPEEVYTAIILVGRGCSAVDARAISNLVASLPNPVEGPDEMWASFTDTEKRVTAALCNGMSNKEISLHTGYAESTVKNTLVHVMDKLGVNSRLQIAIEAGKHRFPTQ
ncbi:response regulator [Rothia sp. ZJ932]|uniref:response regulator n=1 Tax=Rothia sp. ZJ932 TaxID=2810516 RepID=UPI0019676205|nr:response regulator [Rothia sp. ZJ932]QRZ61334.1 response regulator [Rothia sp. ZJ932]